MNPLACPLDEAKTARDRQPISADVVSLGDPVADIADALVVVCTSHCHRPATASVVATALAHGCSAARLLPDAETAVRAAEGVRFTTQRVVGGFVPPVRRDAHDRRALTSTELAEARSALAAKDEQIDGHRRELETIAAMKRRLQNSEAAKTRLNYGRGRLINPNRTWKQLERRRGVCVANMEGLEEDRDRLRVIVESRSIEREISPLRLPDDWRSEGALDYADGIQGRLLLLSDPAGHATVSQYGGAKRLLLGCLGNVSAVTQQVLDWWAGVSSIDASQSPAINTRVVFLCGGGGGATAAAPEGGGSSARGQRDPAADFVFCGVALYQLLQCADVELVDGRASGLARSALRAAVGAARGDDAGWERLMAGVERGMLAQQREGATDDAAAHRDRADAGVNKHHARQSAAAAEELRHLLSVDQYHAVPR